MVFKADLLGIPVRTALGPRHTKLGHQALPHTHGAAILGTDHGHLMTMTEMTLEVLPIGGHLSLPGVCTHCPLSAGLAGAESKGPPSRQCPGTLESTQQTGS